MNLEFADLTEFLQAGKNRAGFTKSFFYLCSEDPKNILS